MKGGGGGGEGNIFSSSFIVYCFLKGIKKLSKFFSAIYSLLILSFLGDSFGTFTVLHVYRVLKKRSFLREYLL